MLIFTAFSDTAQYLYNALKSDLTELGVHSGLVTGSKCEATLGMTNFNDVLINFSPTAKNAVVLKIRSRTKLTF